MTKITKKLAETPYTSTEGLEVGRRLRLTQNTVAANCCTPSDTLDTLAKSGWKGDLAAVTALPMAKAVVIPMHTQCLVMEVSSPTCLDVVTVWRERTVRGVKGKLVALCTIRHCSDFILSRGTPRMAGEPEGKAPALTTLPTRLPAMQTIDMTPTVTREQIITLIENLQEQLDAIHSDCNSISASLYLLRETDRSKALEAAETWASTVAFTISDAAYALKTTKEFLNL